MSTAYDCLFVGAGALGTMYAHQLHQRGVSVGFVADPARAAELSKTGRVVNGQDVRLPVVSFDDPPNEAPKLLIVALKDRHLDAMLESIARLCGPDTTVVSVMNGIDSEQRLAAALGDSLAYGRVLYCMTAGMDVVREGTRITYQNIGTIFVGRASNHPDLIEPRVSVVRRLLLAGGLAVEVPADMLHALWNKFMLNVAVNQWSAVLGATYGVFHAPGRAQELVRAAMREVQAVAAAQDVQLTDDDIEKWFALIRTLRADGKTSMLQDVEAGRPTEVAMFAGRVVELGARYGIPTPVNHILEDALRVIDSHGLRAL